MNSDKTFDFRGAPAIPRATKDTYCLMVLSGPEQGAVFPLALGETVIGRCDERSQIVLSERGVSRAHAKFVVEEKKVEVVDLDSTNGVFINGSEQPTKKALLKPGDTIALSEDTSLRVTLEDEQVGKVLSELYKEAVLDTSGVLTRKAFFQRLTTGPDACIAVVELDKLEQVRDRFGHTVGEELVDRVAEILKSGVADKGKVGRLSGEGFVVNLSCRALDADEVLEGIRKGIEFSNFKVNTKTGIEFLRVTVSVGIASLVSEEDLDESLAAAEAALVMAKQMGRNRLHLSERKKFGK